MNSFYTFEKMKVLLKLVKQDGFMALEVQEDDLIAVAVEKVAERYSVHPRQVRIIFKQYILQARQTFRQANVVNDAVLIVTLQSQSRTSETPPVEERDLPKNHPDASRIVYSAGSRAAAPEPLPRSYLTQIGVSSAAEQAAENPSQLAGEPKPMQGINPRFIEGMCGNPLLPAYLEELCESQERLSACLRNPNVQAFLHEFAGGDTMLEANLLHAAPLQKLLKRSMDQAQNQQQRKLAETSEYEALREKWHRELCDLRATGLPIREIQVLDLLERYSGDVQKVLQALLRK